MNKIAPEALPGFVHEVSAHGTLYRRQRLVADGTLFGNQPLHEAQTASPHVLAMAAREPTLLDVSPNSLLFLDTETTGLSRGTGTVAFLVGMAWFTAAGDLVLEQLFLHDIAAEVALLEHVRSAVERARGLVTFNGVSFDLPLLQTRCTMSRLSPLTARPHLDLLPVARRLHGRRFGGCRLGTIERNVLGFVREGDIAGSDIAGRYRDFLRTGDGAGLTEVFQHNAWDILSLVALVGLYGAPRNRLSGNVARPLQPALPGFERLVLGP